MFFMRMLLCSKSDRICTKSGHEGFHVIIDETLWSSFHWITFEEYIGQLARRDDVISDIDSHFLTIRDLPVQLAECDL